jgi:hypothetical protein
MQLLPQHNKLPDISALAHACTHSISFRLRTHKHCNNSCKDVFCDRRCRAVDVAAAVARRRSYQCVEVVLSVLGPEQILVEVDTHLRVAARTQVVAGKAVDSFVVGELVDMVVGTVRVVVGVVAVVVVASAQLVVGYSQLAALMHQVVVLKVVALQ